jgi:hypothetical protein
LGCALWVVGSRTYEGEKREREPIYEYRVVEIRGQSMCVPTFFDVDFSAESKVIVEGLSNQGYMNIIAL